MDAGEERIEEIIGADGAINVIEHSDDMNFYLMTL